MGSTLPLLEIVAFRFSRTTCTTATRGTGCRPLNFTSTITVATAPASSSQNHFFADQFIHAPCAPGFCRTPLHDCILYRRPKQNIVAKSYSACLPHALAHQELAADAPARPGYAECYTFSHGCWVTRRPPRRIRSALETLRNAPRGCLLSS